MRILVIEPCSDGHRAVYATRLVRGAIARGHQVVFATLDEPREHDEYRGLVRDQLEGLTILRSEARLASYANRGSLRFEVAHWLLFRGLYLQSLRGQDFDMVIVCYLDCLLNVTAVIGSPFDSTPFAGIVMKLKFHHSRVGINTPVFKFNPVKERLFYRLLKKRHLHSIFTIDETLADWIAEERAEYRSKVTFVPDPADFQHGAEVSPGSDFERQLQSSARGPTILVYGWLNRRKGVPYLLSAFQSLVDEGVEANILLAGQQDEFVRQLLSRVELDALKEAGLIRIIDRYISSAEEYLIFRHADMVWLAYEDFYVMSGVMVQAGKMGLPIIASDKGLVSYITDKYNCGEMVNLEDEAGICHAIRSLVENELMRKSLGDRAREKYSDHTVENFIKRIFCRLERPLV